MPLIYNKVFVSPNNQRVTICYSAIPENKKKSVDNRFKMREWFGDFFFFYIFTIPKKRARRSPYLNNNEKKVKR